jgi:hypothetical protein
MQLVQKLEITCIQKHFGISPKYENVDETVEILRVMFKTKLMVRRA